MFTIHTNTVHPDKNPIASSPFNDIANRIARFLCERSEFIMDHPEMHAGDWYEVRNDEGIIVTRYEFGKKSVWGAVRTNEYTHGKDGK